MIPNSGKIFDFDAIGKETYWICTFCQNDDSLTEEKHLHYYNGPYRFCCVHCKRIFEMIDDEWPLFEEVK